MGSKLRWHGDGVTAYPPGKPPRSQPSLSPDFRFWTARLRIIEVDRDDVDAAVQWVREAVGPVLSHEWEPGYEEFERHYHCDTCECETEFVVPDALAVVVRVTAQSWEDAKRIVGRVRYPEHVRELEAA